MTDAEPFLASIQRFPIKSLDPERRERATLTDTGALVGDREWAILDRPTGAPYDPTTADVTGTGDYVNGKKTDAVHRLRSQFHVEREGGPAVTLHRQSEDPSDARRFDLYRGKSDRENGDDETRIEETVHVEINEWLTAYFGRPVSVRRERA
ncbi:MAG: MOSC N-terminal beta barrel domain-containing protein, partial [Natronomonas sp.]